MNPAAPVTITRRAAIVIEPFRRLSVTLFGRRAAGMVPVRSGSQPGPGRRAAVRAGAEGGNGRFGPVTEQQPVRSTFAGWMGSMWLYTILRFGLFFALWGLLHLFGLPGFAAPVIALVLSVPL